MSRDKTQRVASWNVNGIRSCARKGFGEALARLRPFALGLQEIRAPTETALATLDATGATGERWSRHVLAAQRPGYSGVAMLSRAPWDELQVAIGEKTMDVEGRWMVARFGRLWVANGYFPNGKGPERDNSRVPFKMDFTRRVFAFLEPLHRAGEAILVAGDFNTAHKAIDLARPTQNAKVSGFLPEERAELDRWIEAGWVDTFRLFSDRPEAYTWWSQRSGARERNVGWRIDYMFASPALVPFVRKAQIHADITGSDHCPISVDLDATVLQSA